MPVSVLGSSAWAEEDNEMIYRREDVATVRTLWLPAVRKILDVCKPFTNYGVGFLAEEHITAATPLPVKKIKWLDNAEPTVEPLQAAQRVSVMSVGIDLVDGELWGILTLAAPLERLDALLVAFDEGKQLVFYNEIGKPARHRYVSVVVSGVTRLLAMPGAVPHIGFVFDPEDVVSKVAK